MKYYSTKNKDHFVDLRTAVLKSLPPDNGLYMPEQINPLSKNFFTYLDKMSLQDIAYEACRQFLDEDFSGAQIADIANEAINFAAPVVTLNDHLSIQELWHGPSLAFKDFGARFMANIMGRLVADEDRKLTILVATSGDTGGAVAAGFLGVEGVEVIILYPKGKVSPLQEKQLTTLGQNITALEVDGTFDDCQTMVKTAFLDQEINDQYLLSSANSINIARLIPQSFYYFEGYKEVMDGDTPVNFCIPSGNFGNLTAGILAMRMGLPINRLIAATNVNDVVPRYLNSGSYDPVESVQTVSNAMDVGNPSNFRRIENLFDHSWSSIKDVILGYRYTDEETCAAVKEVNDQHNYMIDPHGAVGYLAAQEYAQDHGGQKTVILETAHPAKFLPVMEPILGKIDVPDRLAVLSDKEKSAISISTDFDPFKGWLLSRG